MGISQRDIARAFQTLESRIANIQQAPRAELSNLSVGQFPTGIFNLSQFTGTKQRLSQAAISEQSRRQVQRGAEIQVKTVGAVSEQITKQFATQEKRFMDIFMEQEKRLEEKTADLLTNLRAPTFQADSQIKQNGQFPIPLIALAVVGALLLG